MMIIPETLCLVAAVAGTLILDNYKPDKPDPVAAKLTAMGAEFSYDVDEPHGVDFVTLRGKQFTDEHVALLDRYPTLFGVTLKGTRITGSGFKNWRDHRRLTMFWCEDSPLSDEGLRNLSLAEAVSEVRLEGVDVSEDGWESIAKIKRLKWLTVCRARSTDAGVKCLAKSTAPLDGIALDDVPIGDEAVAVLGRLGVLRTLSLDGTHVTDAGLAALKGLDNLEELELARCRVTGEGIKELAHLAKLRRLVIERSGLNDDGLREVARLPALKDLWANGTPITNAGLRYLREARSLDTLLANDTAIDDEGLREIGAIEGLTDLQLRRTRISGEGLAYLAGLTKLQRLSLEGTRVNSAGMRHLAGLKSLCGLWIKGTDVDDSGLLYLTELPRLRLDSLESKHITEGGRVQANLRSASFKSDVDPILMPLGGAVKPSRRSRECYRLELTGPKVDDAAIVRSGVLFIGWKSPVEMVLSSSRIGAEGFETICSTRGPTLRELDLTDTAIDDGMLAPLSKATGLISLTLDGTHITNRAIKALAPLRKLEHLSLRGTAINDSALKDLGALVSLKEVELDRTYVSAAAAERFASSLRRGQGVNK